MRPIDELTKKDIEDHEEDIMGLRPSLYLILQGEHQERIEQIRAEGKMLQRFARTFG